MAHVEKKGPEAFQVSLPAILVSSSPEGLTLLVDDAAVSPDVITFLVSWDRVREVLTGEITDIRKAGYFLVTRLPVRPNLRQAMAALWKAHDRPLIPGV